LFKNNYTKITAITQALQEDLRGSLLASEITNHAGHEAHEGFFIFFMACMRFMGKAFYGIWTMRDKSQIGSTRTGQTFNSAVWVMGS
jgi:hypothetical protein